MPLRFGLVADGTSDRALMPILDWVLREQVSEHIAIEGVWADLRWLPERPRRLDERIAKALELRPCDLLFVHRDTEGCDPTERLDEIIKAAAGLAPDMRTVPIVPVVPVRMTEAWLLHDQAAIRKAAGNPHGRMNLKLPRLRDIEHVASAKECLYQALRAASGLSGRRLASLDIRAARARVAELIADYAPLRQLAAFQRLEASVAELCRQMGWSRRA